jgi:hypothetical protein
MINQIQLKLYWIFPLLLTFAFACNNKQNSSEKDNKNIKPIIENSISVPKYQVIKEITTRFDKAPSLYIKIDPIDLNNSKFKDDVKVIIKDIALKHGKKFSAHIYDDQSALELSFKEYGDMSLQRPLNKKEQIRLAEHYISSYTGELSTNFASYTIDFFPATINTDKKVGKYVEFGLEFEP